MMILHGDDQAASRNQFLLLKQQVKNSGKNIVEFAGENLVLPDLIQALESSSLFGNVNYVVIESLFSRRPSAEKKRLIDYLSNQDLLIWEPKDVTAQVKNFPNKKFDLPKYIFQFLDDFTLQNLELALKNSEPEIILSLLAKRLHDLVLALENKLELPSWQLAKIQKQSQKYNLQKLSAMNNELLTLDYNQKTSKSPYDLSVGLELWIMKL